MGAATSSAHRFFSDVSSSLALVPTPPTLPRTPRRAIDYLKKVDPKLGVFIDRVGPFRLVRRTAGTHFDAVCRSIIYQQLSGKAAATIHDRVLGLYGGRAPLPSELAATSDEHLRGVGLSRQKLSYLKDLAVRVAANELPIDTLHELPDDEVIDALVRVKGVGRWTAQMFLMFRLGRPDVLPELDLGNPERRFNSRTAFESVHCLSVSSRSAQRGHRIARWRPGTSGEVSSSRTDKSS